MIMTSNESPIQKHADNINIIEKSPDSTLSELAKPFGVYPSTIEHHLKRLGITQNETRKNEQHSKRIHVLSYPSKKTNTINNLVIFVY